MGEIIIIRVLHPDETVFERVIVAVNGDSEQHSNISSIELIFPGLRINMDKGIVTRNDFPIQLNNCEYRLLCHFARYPGRIFTKDQLYEAVYGEPCYHTNTIPTAIWRLRNKIGRDPQFIKTVVGIGYKFEIPTE